MAKFGFEPMHLQRLDISNLRNLIAVELQLNPSFNVFFGPNGSGKTSILEAIYMLGLGRSFRTHLTRRIIHDKADSLAIFAQLYQDNLANTPIGVEKSGAGEVKIKIAGEIQKNIVKLAQILPLQLINSDSFQLIDDGPKYRRQFLDWGLFHVEHSFLALWREFYQILKQRNAALKSHTTYMEISAWDVRLVEVAEAIEAYRATYVSQLQPHALLLFQQLSGLEGLSFDYQKGWDGQRHYHEILKDAYKTDLRFGHTQYGPHRSDLVMKINKVPVQDFLSRGQQKLLLCALSLAQGRVLRELSGKNCLYLIDDLPAELDYLRLQNIVKQLIDLKAQVFVTGINRAQLGQLLTDREASVFHVKHGTVHNPSSTAIMA